LIDAARATREGRVLEWFAQGQTVGRAFASGSETVVELDDIRYGLPGHPRDGFWGLRFRFAATGAQAAPVVRFNRPLPPEASRLIGNLWREAYFN
jgi:hypothetical protein